MKRHFQQELDALRKRLIEMSLFVQQAIDKAVDALLQRNAALAEEVFAKEKQIDKLEMEIDDKGHSLLALTQPMASDMRFITSVLKINTDLERLGDHAVNIAERAQLLAQEPRLETDIHLPEMTQAVRKMLETALRAFITGDTKLAREVLKSDDEVDAYNHALYERIQSLMESDPYIIKTGMKLVRIGHDLERIADLANNIAEDVIYLEQGREVRHGSEAE